MFGRRSICDSNRGLLDGVEDGTRASDFSVRQQIVSTESALPEWMADASCFMSSFSAWTFTGAAGFAYKYGILIIVLFYFNVISFLFLGRFIADKCRQTRRY